MEKNNKIIFVLSLLAVLFSVIALYYSGVVVRFFKEKVPVPDKISRIGVGIVSVDEGEIQRYGKFVQYFSERSQNGWYLVPVKDYGSFINKMQTGQIQAGFAGSAAGYKLISEQVALPVFRPEFNGVSTYSTYVIARKSSGITKIEDLAGKRFAYVDPFTSAGYLEVKKMLSDKGFKPDEYFKAMNFLGSHRAVISEVRSGKYDAGGLKSTVYERALITDPSIADDLMVIINKGIFPESTFIIGKTINYEKEIFDIKRTIANMKNSDEGRAVLKEFGADNLIETSVNDFDEVKKLFTN